MLAGAVREYVRRYGVSFGRRTLLAINNDSVYAAARDLVEADVTVIAIVDSREDVPDRLHTQMRSLSIDIFPRTIPTKTHGFGTLRGVTVSRL